MAPGSHQQQLVAPDAVDLEPVRFDVEFAIALPVAPERVVAVARVQALAFNEQSEDPP